MTAVSNMSAQSFWSMQLCHIDFAMRLGMQIVFVFVFLPKGVRPLWPCGHNKIHSKKAWGPGCLWWNLAGFCVQWKWLYSLMWLAPSTAAMLWCGFSWAWCDWGASPLIQFWKQSLYRREYELVNSLGFSRRRNWHCCLWCLAARALLASELGSVTVFLKNEQSSRLKSGCRNVSNLTDNVKQLCVGQKGLWFSFCKHVSVVVGVSYVSIQLCLHGPILPLKLRPFYLVRLPWVYAASFL